MLFIRQQRQTKDLKEEIDTVRKREGEQKRRKEAAVSISLIWNCVLSNMK